MKKSIVLILIITSAILIEGCAAPGSASGNLKIIGSLVSDNDIPIANRDIEFILPAAYGFGGFDLVMGSPEDFGHTDHRFMVTTDVNGEFEQDLGGRIYHIACWFLPPVGCYPKGPPAPFLLARFPDIEEEYYAIQSRDGKFKIYSYSGQEIPLSESLVVSISALQQESKTSEAMQTVGVIDFKVRSE